MDLIEKYNG